MLAVCLVFWEKRERECMWLKISDLKLCLCMLQAVFICFGKRERMYVIEDQWFKAVPMYVTSCFRMFWEKRERESVCDCRSVIQSSADVCYKLFSCFALFLLPPDWKSHGSEYYECSRYKENPNIANESVLVQAREALKKYLFYFERVSISFCVCAF